MLFIAAFLQSPTSPVSINEYGSMSFEAVVLGDVTIKHIVWTLNGEPLNVNNIRSGINMKFNQTSTSANIELSSIFASYDNYAIHCMVRIAFNNNPTRLAEVHICDVTIIHVQGECAAISSV